MGDRSSWSLLMIGDEDFVQFLRSSVSEFSTRVSADLGAAWEEFCRGLTRILLIQLSDRTAPDALDLVRKCRRSDPRLIIFAVSNSVVRRAVPALQAGADDHLAYPLDLEEFRLRLDRLVGENRRSEAMDWSGSSPNGPGFCFAGVEVRPDLTLRFPDGSEEPIRGKQLGILRMFAERAGELVLKDELIRSVWGWEGPCFGNSVNQHISTLRRLFRRHQLELDRWISTVPKAGWRVHRAVAEGAWGAPLVDMLAG